MQTDIILMAQEANRYASNQTGDSYEWHFIRDERFAALVAAAEREACAKFLERGVDMAGLAGDPVMQKYTADLLSNCAAAIRARGQQ